MSHILRHIKCDEARPSCCRCTSTGRKCDGYVKASDLEFGQSTCPNLGTDGLGLMTVAPIPILRSEQERLAQEYFQVQTVTQWTEIFKSELWDRYVLQLSLTEPSLHHAKLAIAAMHRSLTADIPTKEYELFAIRQYNKAISHVVRPLKPLLPIVVLIVCWMFSCFELMRGDNKTLGRHLISGLQLISLRSRKGHFQNGEQGYGLRDNAENQIIEECLIQFSSLDLQMIIYEPGWIPFSMVHCPKFDKPSAFSSVAAARRHLTALLLRMMEVKRLEVRQDATSRLEIISSKRKNTLEDLDWWSAAFESYLDATTRSVKKEQLRAVQLLEIQHLAAYIHLSIAASDEDTSYDKFLPEFQRIVSTCSTLLTTLDKPSNSKHQRPKKFLYEHGVIPSLYLVGYKCRDPILRRQAHRLLACIRRKEGVWESDLMAKVVEHIIAVEESDRVVCTSSDIPNAARVWREHIQARDSGHLPKVLFEIKVNSNEGAKFVERELD